MFILEGCNCTGKSTLLNLINRPYLHFPTNENPGELEQSAYNDPLFRNEYGIKFRRDKNPIDAWNDQLINIPVIIKHNLIVDRFLISTHIYNGYPLVECLPYKIIVLYADDPNILTDRFKKRIKNDEFETNETLNRIPEINEKFKNLNGDNIFKIKIDGKSSIQILSEINKIVGLYRMEEKTFKNTKSFYDILKDIVPVGEHKGRVVRVYDGDTIWVALYDKDLRIKVRLADIDAPELKTNAGKESAKKLRDLIMDKDVIVSVERMGKYLRHIGQILVEPTVWKDITGEDTDEPININQWMLDNKLAVLYGGKN